MNPIDQPFMKRFSDQLVTPRRLHDLYQLHLLFNFNVTLKADGDRQGVGFDRVANRGASGLERNRLSERMSMRDYRTRGGVPGVNFHAARWWDGRGLSREGFRVGFRGRTPPELGAN
jgi:hypothetical protein